MSNEAKARAELTGAGGAFEVVDETVGGIDMKVYKDRLRHLRAVAELAAGRGDDVFLVYGDDRITFGQFFERANKVSAGLRAHGIGKGDRVAVLSANNPDWCVTFWATVNIGAILVGLNGWWKTDEILYGLQDSAAKVLVGDQGRLERLGGHLDQLPDLEQIFLIDGEPDSLDGLAADGRLHPFDELAGGVDPGLPTEEIDEDDQALIFYTSGTTGRPKGAISTHRNMIANLQNTIYNAVASRNPRPAAKGGDKEAGGSPPGQTISLMTSPLFHVAGLHSSLVVGTLAGVRLIMTKGRFGPEMAFRLIEEEKVTIWATVPTMVWRACEWEGRSSYDTSTVTTVAFGGSPASEELRRMIADTFPNMTSTSNVYGLTESNSAATIINGADLDLKPGSVGLPVPVVDLKVVGPDGAPLPAGEAGEVLIKGPIITPGYWNKPEATAETIIDGWLHSGDIGYIDDDGYLFITDRAKDMIIRGGENIYCAEIENRLVAHPKVADAGVVGVAHLELGEEVKAIVQVDPDDEVSEDEIREWVAETLANFKVPTYVELTTENLPRNPSGKLLKNVLRGEAENQFTDSL